jgi:hypothetical protein
VVFPNVRALRYSPTPSSSEENFNHLQLVGQRLEVLSLLSYTHNPDTSLLRRIVTELPTRFQNLIQLSFYSVHPIDDTFSDVVCQYRSLRRLEISCVTLTPRAVQHIIGLQELVHLEWNIGAYKPTGDVTARPFRKLRHWEQFSKKMEPFLQLMSRLTSRMRVENLILKVGEIENGAEALSALSYIENGLCHEALT